jgi:hypothetical protein
LSNLSEGDADETRQLVTAGLAGEGKVSEAISTATACSWWHRRIIAFLAGVRALPQGSPDRTRIAAEIGEIITPPEGDAFKMDSLRAICATALELGDAHSTEALQLVESAKLAFASLGRAWLTERLEVALEIQKTLAKLDRNAGATSGIPVGEWVLELASGGLGELDSGVFPPLFSLCAVLIESGAAQQELFDHVFNWANALPLEGEDRIRLAASAGGAAASFDTARAAQLILGGSEDLAKLTGSSQDESSLAFFKALVSELTGSEHESPWVQPLLELTGTLVETGEKLEEEILADLLGRLGRQIFALTDEARQLEYATRKYLTSLSKLPSSRQAALRSAVVDVAGQLDLRRTDLKVDRILGDLIFQLGARGHDALAREVAPRIVDAEARGLAERQIELFAEFFALLDRTPMEQTLFDILEEKGIAAAAATAMRNGEIDDVLAYELHNLKELRVRHELFDWAPLAAAAAMSRWGAEAGIEMLNAVAMFDQRLIEAASRIL